MAEAAAEEVRFFRSNPTAPLIEVGGRICHRAFLFRGLYYLCCPGCLYCHALVLHRRFGLSFVRIGVPPPP